jgi:predicted DCC family thiol-disulfide oxidoreductase YuxK
MILLAPLVRHARGILAGLARAWSDFWFESSSTTPLEIARIGIGAAVLFHYAMATPFLLDLWGDEGLMPRAAALDTLEDSWMQSVFFYFTAPWQWIAFHALFLFCCAAFMVGWRTSWVKWIVLVGQISYDYRNSTIAYGAESIIACLLVILCLAPIGRAMSLDRVRAVRAAKLNNLQAAVPPYASPWANACTRLVQIQMVALFFYSGAEKIRGDEWWSGDAVWLALTTYEFYNPVLLNVVARQYWIITFFTYVTIMLEIAYPFLIWQRRTRPYLLAGAILLHVMFAVCLGLVYFSFVMILGHVSFARPEWLQTLGARWKRRIGGMEIVYDSRCGFCVRLMARLLAFDGLGQISTRDFRAASLPAVPDTLAENALCLILPDGRTLPAFEVLRHVALRVPGLWWLAPLLCVPVVSRLFGRLIHHRLAAERRRPSAPELSMLPRAPVQS